MRRTLTILAISIVLLGLGVWAYFAFFMGQPSVVVAPAATVTLDGTFAAAVVSLERFTTALPH